ncbi:MAG: hypothetical protein ACXWEM_06420 [Halobacteriota archaeon]
MQRIRKFEIKSIGRERQYASLIQHEIVARRPTFHKYSRGWLSMIRVNQRASTSTSLGS